VVQGALGELPGDQLRVDAALVDVGTAAVAPPAQGTSPLDQLFNLEKQIAFTVLANLGIQLSPAEQEAISQRPTQNLQAFLAYSRGLVDQDRGDFGAAQAEFNQAATLDPDFRAASQSATAASDLSAASEQQVSQVETAVSVTSTFTPPTPPTAPSTQAALEAGLQSVAPPSTPITGSSTATASPTTTRNPTSEASQTEGPAPPTGKVVITIRRPS
jgi:hypothetical protein